MSNNRANRAKPAARPFPHDGEGSLRQIFAAYAICSGERLPTLPRARARTRQNRLAYVLQ